MIKLIAFDLDGTVLTSDKRFTEATEKAFKAAKEQNILLVPATGRIISFIPKDIMEAAEPAYVISSNGASVKKTDNGEILYSACIDREKAQEVQSFLDNYRVYTEYYQNGIPYTVKGSPEKAKLDPGFPKSKHSFLNKPYHFVESFHELLEDPKAAPEKINLTYLPEDIRAEIKHGLEELGGLKLSSSIPDNLEINSPLATKGQALKALCSRLSIKPAECMALGDNGNDLDMLSFAGYSVATANASPEAAKTAGYMTESCDEDGAAKAIMKMLNENT